MKSPKSNPHAMAASRALRDYLKHERITNQANAEANTFCFCVGFMAQTSFDTRQAAVVLDQLETDIDLERGKLVNDWRFNLRMFLTLPGRYGWNTFLRSILSLILLTTLSALGQVTTNYPGQIHLSWDASMTPNVTYRLWASNSPAMFTNVNTGTNLSVRLTGLQPGKWLFYSTSVNSNGVHSLPSNSLILDVPATPAMFRNVVIQYSTNLTNFSDVGFFRLYIPTP